MTTTRPEDCRTIDCGDGYEIRPSCDRWAVFKGGCFVEMFGQALWAMKAVELLKDAEVFKPQEVAYRPIGGSWKRKVVKTRAAFDRLIEKLADDGAEVLTRDAE